MTPSAQLRALAATDRANGLPRHADRLDRIADAVARLEDRCAMWDEVTHLHPMCSGVARTNEGADQ